MKKWSELSADEKAKWQAKALEHLYLGLEPTWVKHNEMRDILAKALYKLSCLAESGHLGCEGKREGDYTYIWETDK